MAQIKACMSAASEPVACVMLRVDGSIEKIVTDQRKMGSILGGRPTFVGAIASLGVQAVACDGAKKKSKHTFAGANFEPTIKGDVLLFRIDDDASPLPFTPVEYKAWVDAGCPDEVSEAEEDSEDELEGAEEESDSDGEESDEEEEETLESFGAKMKELPLKDLKLVAVLPPFHPGRNPGVNIESVSHRCHPVLVAFVWEWTTETINLPLGCSQGGSGWLTILKVTSWVPWHRSVDFGAGKSPDSPNWYYKSLSRLVVGVLRVAA